MGIISCNNPTADTAVEAAGDRIIRAEPLSWWVGMRTPLQLMVQGKDISSCEVEMARGTRGVRVTATHKADNADFLFIDIDIAPDAAAGEYEIIFTRGEERFVLPYSINSRREDSAARQSFTTADMIYLLMPDRFANGDPANDATEDTREKPDRAGCSTTSPTDRITDMPAPTITISIRVSGRTSSTVHSSRRATAAA